MKTITSPLVRIAPREVSSVERIVPLSVRMTDLRMLAWFGVVENHVVDVLLATSFIDRCIPNIPFRAKNRPVAFSTNGNYTNAG